MVRITSFKVEDKGSIPFALVEHALLLDNDK